jgi:NADPH-dependent curcumin reductase CurA
MGWLAAVATPPRVVLAEHGLPRAHGSRTADTRQALQQALTEFGSKGIDIYYENVGGPTLDIVLELAAPFGRIVACGMISQVCP